MRIAFVINNYPPRVGGVELHVHALATELVRLGHEPLVVTLGPDTGWRDDAGVSVLTLPEHFRVGDVLGFPSLGTRRRLTRLLREHKIDVVSTHTRFFPISLVGLRAAHRAGLPVVHTEHGSGFVAGGSAIMQLASRAVDLTLGRWVLRHADRVLGVSENVVEFVRSLSGAHAEVFYNAIPVGDGVDAGAKAVAARDRPGHLVFVGRIVEGKGWEAYLETLAALHAQGRPVTGEVLGDGVQMPQLRLRVQELGLEDVVAVRGRVTQAEVREALRGATLVNPTTLSEGFQTSLLEAIAEQGRVVTYPVPGAVTLQQQGAPVAITADRDVDALITATAALLDHPGAPAAPELLTAWTWPERAREYVTVCEQVLTASP